MAVEFQPWPKLHRLTGPVIVTEKVDGTNACVIITDTEVVAQSRTRIITPEKDNFGFAAWVRENAGLLRDVLGEGRHFGEWYGRGIQRGYDLDYRRFALFNTSRFDDAEYLERNSNNKVTTVPVLYTGPFWTHAFDNAMEDLRRGGSFIAPGFMNPEGIVVYDTRSGQGWKKTFEYDGTGKGRPKDEHGNVV